jgi:protein deglycase
MSKKALIILADGFEEIEAISVIDILRRAGIEVTVAGLEAMEIKGSHAVAVTCDARLADTHTDFDAIILPGGMPGAMHLATSVKVASIVKDFFARGKIVAAICASPAVVLAPLGILDNKSATCFPTMEKEFHPSTVFKPHKVVVDGTVITSRSPGTAAYFALAIAEKLAGKDKAEQLRKGMLIE